MADKSFGVKELNLLNASGTPTVTSPNNLNLNANTVAISTSATVGNNLTVSGQINVGSNIKIGNAGVVTATSFVGSGANLTGISAGISTDPSNVQATWKLGGGSGSGFTFTGPGQDGSEGNPDIYLVRGQRYLFDNTTLAGSHPFEFRNEANNADYTDGVSGAQNGLQYINVQHDAPAALKYRCTIHTSSMLGNIYIVGQHLANGVNNRVLTATSAYGMNGESNLLFDGNDLTNSGGDIAAANGSQGSPSFRNYTDTDTGMFFPSANNLAFATGGFSRVVIDDNDGMIIGNGQVRSTKIGNRLTVGGPTHAGITIKSGTSSAGSLYFSDGTSGDDEQRGLVQYDHSGNFLRFYTNAVERLRIDSSGRVSIGATSGGNADTDDLIVSGSGKKGITLCSTDGSESRLTFADGLSGVSAVAGSILYTHSNDSMDFQTNTTRRLRIDSVGRVMIGTIDAGGSNADDLTVATSGNTGITIRSGTSNTGNIFFSDATSGAAQYAGAIEFYHSDNSLRFNVANTNYLRINSSGNVHIGSGDPTIAKLQVSGAGFFGSANTTKTNDGVIIERNSGDGEAHITAGRSGGNYSGLQFYVAGASGVTKRYAIDYLSNFKWFAANGTTERAKITSDGYSKFTSDGTYDGYSNASQAHEFRQSLNKPTLWCSNSSSAQTWDIIRAESARTGNSAFQFIVCTSGNLTDDEFRVRGDGNVYADGTFNPNGADYAEYFEWTDGNSSNEDRRGMTVVLDGNKIKVSTSSDSTDNIIGVVSGNASVIGDSSWNKWSGKYQKDDYGTYLKDENGDRKLNPSFDDTKTYVSREDRQEWDAIGMVGKLRIRKGQKTGTRWIKMRDISDTVEEWLVR